MASKLNSLSLNPNFCENVFELLQEAKEKNKKVDIEFINNNIHPFQFETLKKRKAIIELSNMILSIINSAIVDLQNNWNKNIVLSQNLNIKYEIFDRLKQSKKSIVNDYEIILDKYNDIIYSRPRSLIYFIRFNDSINNVEDRDMAIKFLNRYQNIQHVTKPLWDKIVETFNSNSLNERNFIRQIKIDLRENHERYVYVFKGRLAEKYKKYRISGIDATNKNNCKIDLLDEENSQNYFEIPFKNVIFLKPEAIEI